MKRLNMKMLYSFPPISKHEQEQLTYVFLEELELQNWFTVAYLSLLGTEVVFFTQ